MTASETLVMDKYALEFYNLQRSNYKIVQGKQSNRINEERIEILLYKKVYRRPFPWIFMKKEVNWKSIEVPYKLLEDKKGVENYLKELILYKGNYYFDSRNDWFKPDYIQ